MVIRPEVQQIVEVLGEIKGASDLSDSTDTKEDSQRGADIEDQGKYGDRAASQGHVPPDVVVQVGGVTNNMAEDVTSNVAEGATSAVADGISSMMADDVNSNERYSETPRIAEGPRGRR